MTKSGENLYFTIVDFSGTIMGILACSSVGAEDHPGLTCKAKLINTIPWFFTFELWGKCSLGPLLLPVRNVGR